MFRSLNEKQKQLPQVNLTINGKPVTAPQGQSLWATMALAGEASTRLSPVTQKNRSAYCAMGVCFECMVEINGMPNQQACLHEVQEGMCIRFQEITEQTALPGISDSATALSDNSKGNHG